MATGPLTNVALALRAAPDLAGRVAGISLMGGGTFGNRSAAAEFNIWADPEAAAIVFGCGAPLIMAGLDVTHQLLVTPARIADVDAVEGRLAAVLADLFRFFSGTYMRRHDDIAGAALHDPLAVLAVTHPDLFQSTPRHVVVETRGEHTRGMTVIDHRTLIEREPPNCTVLDSSRRRRRLEGDRRRHHAATSGAHEHRRHISTPVRAHPALHARRAARPRDQPRRRTCRVRPQRRRHPTRSTAFGSSTRRPATNASSPTPTSCCGADRRRAAARGAGSPRTRSRSGRRCDGVRHRRTPSRVAAFALSRAAVRRRPDRRHGTRAGRRRSRVRPAARPDGHAHRASSPGVGCGALELDGGAAVRWPPSPATAEHVSWGSADFVAAEEMDRLRGYWWSPAGDVLAVCRVDVSEVPVWHISNPGRSRHAAGAGPLPGGRHHQPRRARCTSARSTGRTARRSTWDRDRLPVPRQGQLDRARTDDHRPVARPAPPRGAAGRPRRRHHHASSTTTTRPGSSSCPGTGALVAPDDAGDDAPIATGPAGCWSAASRRHPADVQVRAVVRRRRPRR